MKITGWIVDPDNRILGATTDTGLDVMFDAEDVVHRDEILSHAVRLAARYVTSDIVLPDEFARGLQRASQSTPATSP